MILWNSSFREHPGWWILFWMSWILLNLEYAKVRSLKVVYPAEMQVKKPYKNQPFRKIHNIYNSQPISRHGEVALAALCRRSPPLPRGGRSWLRGAFPSGGQGVSSPGSGCGIPLQMAGRFMAVIHGGDPTYLVTVMILQVVYSFLNDDILFWMTEWWGAKGEWSKWWMHTSSQDFLGLLKTMTIFHPT